MRSAVQILIFFVLFSFDASYGDPFIGFQGVLNCETAGGIESKGNGEQPGALKKTAASFVFSLCDENLNSPGFYEERGKTPCEEGDFACIRGKSFLIFSSPEKKTARAGFLPNINPLWNFSEHWRCDFGCSAIRPQESVLHRDCYMRALERAVIEEEMIDRETGISYLPVAWAGVPFGVEMEFKGGGDTASFQKIDRYFGEPLGGGGGGGGSQEIREGWFHGLIFLEKETALSDELLKALEQRRLDGAAEVLAYFPGGAAVSDKAEKFGLSYSRERAALWAHSLLSEDRGHVPARKRQVYLFADSFEEAPDFFCAFSRFSK